MTKAVKNSKKITGKTLKDAKKLVRAHNDRVEKDNAAFAKMAPADKRVAIARDVLAQLRTGRLVATPRTWLTGNKLKNSDLNKELKDVLGEMKTCEGCLIGGVFMCAVEKADKLKVSDLEYHGLCNCGSCGANNLNVSEYDAFDYLKKFFSEKQLAMMECVFERGGGAAQEGDLDEKSYADCIEFSEFIDDPKDRMRLVMENVIKNKGTFRPAQRPVTTYVTPGFVG